jgi:hypothetical protein
MKVKNAIFLLAGVIIGWVTVPFLRADSEGNTYKDLLHKMIGIVTQIQITSAETAANTQAIKEKLGAK